MDPLDTLDGGRGIEIVVLGDVESGLGVLALSDSHPACGVLPPREQGGHRNLGVGVATVQAESSNVVASNPTEDVDTKPETPQTKIPPNTPGHLTPQSKPFLTPGGSGRA